MDRDDDTHKPFPKRPILTLKRAKKIVTRFEPNTAPSKSKQPPVAAHNPQQRQPEPVRQDKSRHQQQGNHNKPVAAHRNTVAGNKRGAKQAVAGNKTPVAAKPTKQKAVKPPPPKPKTKPKPPPPPPQPKTIHIATERLGAWLRQQLATWRNWLPLKVGIHEDLLVFVDDHPDKPEQWSHHAIRLELYYHCRQKVYLLRTLEHPYRYDLDGNVCGEVTASERGEALRRLEVILEREKKHLKYLERKAEQAKVKAAKRAQQEANQAGTIENNAYTTQSEGGEGVSV